MDLDAIRLADTLDALAAFLLRNNAPYWADWISSDAMRIRGGDFYALPHLLSAFGGMGSLNDLEFSPINGNATERDAFALNREFQNLSQVAYTQATALYRDAQEVESTR